MYKKLIFSLALSWAAMHPYAIQAQDKTLTISETILKAGTDLAPATLQNLSWIPGTDRLSYIGKKDGNNYLISQAAATAKKDTLLSLTNFNTALKKAGVDTLKRLPSIQWLSQDKFLLVSGNDYIIYNLSSKTAERVNHLQDEANQADLEENTLAVAYTVDNNLFISTKGGNRIQITDEKNKGILYGWAAHRNEFGIEKGTFWSPNGHMLAFYRVDQTMVTDYPIIKIDTRPAHDSLIKYPMAGMKSHQATVGVYNLATKKTIYLKTTGDPEQYLTNISWSPDEKYIYIAVLNRGQNHLWLNKYDANTGDFVKTLFEETNPKYVEPLDPLMFVKNNPDEFLWLSQRDGYKHFYLYNTDGKLLAQPTKGNWVVTGFLGFDKKGKTFYYTSNQESPIDEDIYAAPVNGKGKIIRISNGTGYHFGMLNTDGSYVADIYSSLTVPRIIQVENASGRVMQTLLTAENPLKDYKLGETRFVTMKAADSTTTLYGRIILPPNFDPHKKYPTIVYVYGGPHVQLVINNWLGGSNLWMQYMAQHGYIMFTIDSRGSWNRGQAFEQATFRNLGTAEIADQLRGVAYLKSLPYVDTSRLGVHGWSFGGFMTTSLMTRTPGTFKVAVAGGPVIDWRYYEVMYTERYMDTPQENPEGYDKADVLNYVKNLKGRLLVIHGTSDDVVMWQHSLMLLKKSVDEDVQIDYFVYPGHKHNVIGPDRVHLMEKITRYFDDFLK